MNGRKRTTTVTKKGAIRRPNPFVEREIKKMSPKVGKTKVTKALSTKRGVRRPHPFVEKEIQKMSPKVGRTKVAKGVTLPRGKEEKLRARPGGGSTGKYKNVARKEFAGKSGGTSPYSFPINTLARARNALARAHFAPNPSGIRRAVHKRYPQLAKPNMKKK